MFFLRVRENERIEEDRVVLEVRLKIFSHVLILEKA